MGQVLQIRVMAYTPDVEQAEKRWPSLYRLGWDEKVPESGLDWRDRGVLQLVSNLVDRHSIGILPEKASAALADGLQRAAGLKSQLESAVGDWKPSDANTLSDKLEDLLDELEKDAKKL